VSDPERIAIVIALATVALGLAWWWRARTGSPVDVGGLIDGPGAVIFTRDDCSACTTTLELLEALDLPIRQIRAEDEPGELERRGVTGVPITVVVDGTGRARGQFVGLPKPRALRRAARRAGEIPGPGPREL
jgi:hypothetical protein